MAAETSPDQAIARVVESARRLGVELDEREAAEWVAAMETEASGGDLVVDVEQRRLRPSGDDARLPAGRTSPVSARCRRSSASRIDRRRS